MATNSRLNQFRRAIDRAPHADTGQSAPWAHAGPSLSPPLEVLHDLDRGEELTTEAVIARMGLLPTAQLQHRVAAALHELGYHRVTRNRAGRTVRIWASGATDPVSAAMRRVHQDGDRAHGLTPIARRPGPIARLLRAFRGIL